MDEALRDAERFGLGGEVAAILEAAAEGTDASRACPTCASGMPNSGGPEFGGVWAENAAAVAAFLLSASQWRVVASADGALIFLGLDYSGVRAGLDAAGMPVTPALWEELRVMEGAARDILNGGAA